MKRNPEEIAWNAFKESGFCGAYLLYKAIKEDDDIID